MTHDNPSTPTSPIPGNDPFEPTREDVLIGRVIDGEASSSDWEALDRLGQTEPALWERLGRAQRAHARLEREVDDAIAIAELIELPTGHIASASLSLRIRQYSGWAAAAVLGVALLGSYGWTGKTPGGNTAQIAGPNFTKALSADEALDQYFRAGLASGRVVGEMPAVLMDTRPIQGGPGQEVFFVRQILEREMVTDVSVLSVEIDEHGTPRYVPARPVAPATASPETRRVTHDPRAF